MDNHYHLIGTASKNFPLPKVMEWFQRSANRIVNYRAGRINHLFGGPYRASLIANEYYYFHAIKYVYRNPIEAGIADTIENYPFSTVLKTRIPLVSPVSGINTWIPKNHCEFLRYLNEPYSAEAKKILQSGLKRTQFKISHRLNKSVSEELNRRI